MHEITDTLKTKLKSILLIHEGRNKFPYIDKDNIVNIGYAYNLSSRGLPDDVIERLFEDDINHIYDNFVKTFKWFDDLSDSRKAALIDMAYCHGWKKFLDYKNMLSFIEQNNFSEAGREMLDSNWARKYKTRAFYDYRLLTTGNFI